MVTKSLKSHKSSWTSVLSEHFGTNGQMEVLETKSSRPHPGLLNVKIVERSTTTTTTTTTVSYRRVIMVHQRSIRPSK